MATGAENSPAIEQYVGPVTVIEELYAKFPTGGKYGMWAMVVSKRKFVMWDRDTNTWVYMYSEGTTV